MENNEKEIVEVVKPKEEKPTPFLKRVNELEGKVDMLEHKINTIMSVLKSRR